MKGLETLKKILEDYMGLANRVIFYDDSEMSADENIFILLNILSSQISAHVCEFDQKNNNEPKDIFTVKYIVSAEMAGKAANDEHIDRHFEMAMALKSYIGKQLMEQNGVSIQTLGECKNVSKPEESLCRFRQDFSIMEQVEKSSNAEYFDKLGEFKIIEDKEKSSDVGDEPEELTNGGQQ